MCGASAYCGMLEGRVQQQTLTLLLDFWGCIDHRSGETWIKGNPIVVRKFARVVGKRYCMLE